jgi:methyltransferase (TIGR00027 family)
MREGSPSATARGVASARAGFERLAVDYGNPVADDRLARDVARGDEGPVSETMRRYLQSRTRFFDRVVVNAIARGVRQVVLIGAGYDGRALRYAAPDVRFFEVDHPDTQADKRGRLERLEVDRGTIGFVAFDLTTSGLAPALLDAGLEPEAPLAFLCEGLLVYLEPAAIDGLLDGLRALAAPGTRLAVSSTAGGRHLIPERARFRSRVAELGEPVRNELGAEELRGVLADRRWRPVELSERAAAAGFLVAAPEWAPAPAGVPPTEGRVGRYLEMALYRAGGETLADHLDVAHGLGTVSLHELDAGVFDVRCADGRRLIVRVFPAARSESALARDVELLRELRGRGFPAERPAEPRPMGRHAGQPLLITEFAAGRTPSAASAGYRRLGDLLGQLHTLDVAGWDLAPGGAWHHLVPEGGRPGRELAEMRELLAAAGRRVSEGQMSAYRSLSDRLAEADDCAGLPDALTHPDFVPPNMVGSERLIVDWAGAGVGPRLWSLAFLLWAAGAGGGGGVESVMEGYRAHVELEPEERRRLRAAMLARPVVLAAWKFVTGRQSLTDAAGEAEAVRRRVEGLARLVSGSR